MEKCFLFSETLRFINNNNNNNDLFSNKKAKYTSNPQITKVNRGGLLRTKQLQKLTIKKMTDKIH